VFVELVYVFRRIDVFPRREDFTLNLHIVLVEADVGAGVGRWLKQVRMRRGRRR
jgi:hypothetical protein